MIPEKVASFVGKSGETVIMEVERGAIKKFADAVGDRNPLYWDDEYGRNSRYHSTIAPPAFFGWPTQWEAGVGLVGSAKIQADIMSTLVAEGYPRVLDGGIEFEFFRPVRPGDVLAMTPRIAGVSEREGKAGKMFIVNVEISYINQNGDLVARVGRQVIAR